MMFGLDESFEYMECADCGCLQIMKIPQNMQKYYPDKNYYSFQKIKLNSLNKFIVNKRDQYCLFRNNIIGKLINRIYPNDFFSVLGYLNINIDSKILDVGCGYGEFLFKLNELNFKSLLGIDPYIKKEVHQKNLKILKKDINEFSTDEKFDFIILKHSFEHMENPLYTLKSIKNLLNKKGKCIISIPVKTKTIWNTYGVNWVQIDAPRHFFIPTIKSFEILTNKAGLNINKTIFNSNEFQFWGSEQYKKNIYLESEKSYKNNPKKVYSMKKI